jgi:hypothetical protein
MTPFPGTLHKTDRSSTFHTGTLPPESDEALDRTTIAELPVKQVSRMSRAELARVVRSSPLPTTRARLEYLDHETLQRLAHMACLACRNRR